MAEAIVRLAAVLSLDGKIKRDTAVHCRDWVSAEDKLLFAEQLAWSDAVIAGRKTYRNMKPALDATKHYIIYTTSPDSYRGQAEHDQLTFTDEPPARLISRLSHRGFKKLLLVGGGEINTLFLRERLVHELWLTFEPVIHGAGKPLVSEIPLACSLRLLEIRQLNRQGTLFARYQVTW